MTTWQAKLSRLKRRRLLQDLCRLRAVVARARVCCLPRSASLAAGFLLARVLGFRVKGLGFRNQLAGVVGPPPPKADAKAKASLGDGLGSFAL